MALLTGVLGGGQPDILCSAAEHTSPLSGMIPMYLLMSAFHSPPWLKLISSRGNGTRRARSSRIRTFPAHQYFHRALAALACILASAVLGFLGRQLQLEHDSRSGRLCCPAERCCGYQKQYRESEGPNWHGLVLN
jgi:hypothetical protein